MRLPCVSLHRAIRPLLVPQGARVETAHRRALNLRLDAGALLTLCAPELGNGPGALLVAAEWPLPWRVGERLTVTAEEIRGPGCTLVLRGASGWEPGPLPEVAPLEAVRQGWCLAFGDLCEKGADSLILGALVEIGTNRTDIERIWAIPGSSTGSGRIPEEIGAIPGEINGDLGKLRTNRNESWLLTPIPERFGEDLGEFGEDLGKFRTDPGGFSELDMATTIARGSVAELSGLLALRGLRALQAGDWPRAVQHLVGLGPGLTPSGDDLLAGFLLLAHRSGWATPAPLREAIRSLPPGRTTAVSESLLHWAAEGVANERALHWLDGLLQGAPPPIDPVLAIGATSGADFAAGVLLALDLFLKERAR